MPQISKEPSKASRPLSRTKWLAATGTVIAVISLTSWYFYSNRKNSPAEGVAAVDKQTPLPAAPENFPVKPAADFSQLPPADRINAETKARMDFNAAWRDKLKNGNFSTLPKEAYPEGVHPVSTPAKTKP